MPIMKRCAAAGLAVALTIGLAHNALAADYPTRTVKIIAPFGAGGPADIYTRVIARELEKALHQPFVVENRPGAGTTIGTEVARAVGARWLHLAGGIGNADRQRNALHQEEISSHARSGADLADRRQRPGAGGQSDGAGEESEGAAGAGPGQARRAQFRLIRTRLQLPHGGRAAEESHRHQYRARALSRLGRHAHRHPQRQYPDAVRQRADHGALDQGRKGARVGYQRRQALAHSAECADHRRGRRARISRRRYGSA